MQTASVVLISSLSKDSPAGRSEDLSSFVTVWGAWCDNTLYFILT